MKVKDNFLRIEVHECFPTSTYKQIHFVWECEECHKEYISATNNIKTRMCDNCNRKINYRNSLISKEREKQQCKKQVANIIKTTILAAKDIPYLSVNNEKYISLKDIKERLRDLEDGET